MYKNKFITNILLIFFFSISLLLAGEGTELSLPSKTTVRLILPPLNLSAPIIREEETPLTSPPVRQRFSVQTFTSAVSPQSRLRFPSVPKRKKRTRPPC